MKKYDIIRAIQREAGKLMFEITVDELASLLVQNVIYERPGLIDRIELKLRFSDILLKTFKNKYTYLTPYSSINEHNKYFKALSDNFGLTSFLKELTLLTKGE